MGTADEGGGEVSSDERTWGILAHAAGFVGLVFPFVGNIVGPLLIWVVKKEESAFVDANGRNAVNFQISWTIYAVVTAFSIFIAIGFVLFPLVALGWFILMIIATVRASNNEVYEYPLTIPFISG